MTGQNAHAERSGSALKLTTEEIDKRRSLMPERPCFRCESRDWCEHRPDPDAK